MNSSCGLSLLLFCFLPESELMLNRSVSKISGLYYSEATVYELLWTEKVLSGLQVLFESITFTLWSSSRLLLTVSLCHFKWYFEPLSSPPSSCLHYKELSFVTIVLRGWNQFSSIIYYCLLCFFLFPQTIAPLLKDIYSHSLVCD